VIGCLVAGALVGVLAAVFLSRRIEPPQGVSRGNLGAAIFAGCVGVGGLLGAIIVNV
jgi:hypothetical protein